MKKFKYFQRVRDDILAELKVAPRVSGTRWQSVDISNKKEMVTTEILNYGFELSLPSEKPEYYQATILPNLPWAEDHFVKERVGGQPLNPGQEYKNWPYAKAAEKHRDEIFSHSYAERIWPKYAGQTEGGIIIDDTLSGSFLPPQAHQGIRFDYGDLRDLVRILAEEPLTRQAVLPIWFPEDLQACVEKQRVPCSLFYQFIQRENRLHMVYTIRSCDFVRHFNDDVYMAIRLLLWVLDECRKVDDRWGLVVPGTLTMYATSLHIFEADRRILGIK